MSEKETDDPRSWSSDIYQKTVDRMEPSIHIIDPGYFRASVAISLKRIADSLESLVKDLSKTP